jgi:hypothetical protein
MTKFNYKELIELADNVGLEVTFIVLIGNGEGVEEITWDNSLYYESGNKLIDIYIADNYEKISYKIFGKFLAEMEKSNDEGFYSGNVN